MVFLIDFNNISKGKDDMYDDVICLLHFLCLISVNILGHFPKNDLMDLTKYRYYLGEFEASEPM